MRFLMRLSLLALWASLAWTWQASPKLIFLTTTLLAQQLQAYRSNNYPSMSSSRPGIKIDGKQFFKTFSSKYFSNTEEEDDTALVPATAPVFGRESKNRNMRLFNGGRPASSFAVNSEVVESESDRQRRKDLKSKLFALCAACDRGFAALPADRKEIANVVEKLKALSPERYPTRNLYPFTEGPLERAPLEAAWKMVYTSALDVISLASNPVAQVQAVYQVLARDGSAVNVINLAPRVQTIIPPGWLGDGTIIRLKVFTKAIARNETRIGISFRKVEVKPLKIMNRDVASFLPALRATLPQAALFGSDKEETGLLYEKNTPGYFDVMYLDEDMLVIQQAAPGGIFISIRSPEPIDSFLA